MPLVVFAPTLAIFYLESQNPGVSPTAPTMIFSGVIATVALQILVFVWLASPSQRGGNAFGPDPQAVFDPRNARRIFG